MADSAATTVVIPAFNESASIAGVVDGLRSAATWKEILVVDDGSRDDTSERAATAGARVIRHPYNKGNGSSVKTGIRHAAGEWILIIDGDGQHRPDDAMRLVARLGATTISWSARARRRRRRRSARRLGNTVLARLAGHLANRRIPDLTSGFRAARREYLLEFLHLLPNGFSTPTTTTLAFLRAGYNVRFEPIEARARGRASQKFDWPATARRFS